MKIGCKNVAPILSIFANTIASEILTYTEDLQNLTHYKDAIQQIFGNIQKDPLYYYRQSPDRKSLKFPYEENG